MHQRCLRCDVSFERNGPFDLPYPRVDERGRSDFEFRRGQASQQRGVSRCSVARNSILSIIVRAGSRRAPTNIHRLVFYPFRWGSLRLLLLLLPTIGVFFTGTQSNREKDGVERGWFRERKREDDSGEQHGRARAPSPHTLARAPSTYRDT